MVQNVFRLPKKKNLCVSAICCKTEWTLVMRQRDGGKYPTDCPALTEEGLSGHQWALSQRCTQDNTRTLWKENEELHKVQIIMV